jgi:hypothetical protein
MVYGQTTAQISLSFMIYDNAGGQKTLYSGLDQTATNGIDVHLGESILPPLPPNGAFDARWLLPNNNFNGSLSSWRDYRFASGFPFSGTIEHRFRYQSAAGATAMFVSWNFPPAITALIQDLANGAIINIPISGNGIYQISNFESIDRLKLFIYYNNVVSVEENNPKILSEFNLEQNYPNPFNPSTQIKFSVSKQTQLKINMYNTLGELVQTIAEGVYEPGYYEVTLNAENLVSGVYIYRMESSEIVQSRKLVLIR